MWIGYDYRTVGLCKWDMMATHLLPPPSSKTVLFGLNDFFQLQIKVVINRMLMKLLRIGSIKY